MKNIFDHQFPFPVAAACVLRDVAVEAGWKNYIAAAALVVVCRVL